MRLFTALDLASEHKRLLSSLRRPIPGVIWYPPQTYHLTLRFMGEIRARPQLEEIDHALSAISVPPFDLELAGVGVFSRPTRSRLWVGVPPSEPLTALQAKIESALRRAGLPPEKRRFTPHISLGVFQGDQSPEIVRWVQTHNLLRGAEAHVEHFTLFHSHKTSDEPHYEPCADYPLDLRALPRVEA
ncbi:RNA 2',3'-cyclic phosphodiesterase [Asaia astilbis]|uniref:RNA 2',3'-cyclic phosphodiesterase n=1 Tax=Asaia astilbis TaxID=610244 RepID=UPI0004707AB1|nr:RNA 2',3'-cyclic phosphodiesterase [Asaia astilbis]